MRTFLPLLLLIAGTGCTAGKPLQRGESENNKTYKVDYLFEHEGCKVYRFLDRGNYVYFTNCAGEAINQQDSITVRNQVRRY